MHCLQIIIILHRLFNRHIESTVADPGFDLRGGVDFVNGGWGRKSLKVLTG